MGKGKDSKCHYCGERIKRHDKDRVTVQVGKEATREAHGPCHKANS